MEITLTLDEETLLRVAVEMFQILCKKYFKQFLIAFKSSPNSQIQGNDLEKFFKYFEIRDYGFSFKKECTEVNNEPFEDNTSFVSIMKKMRNLREEAVLIGFGKSSIRGNKKDFILNLKFPKTEARKKIDEDFERDQKLKSK